MKAIRARAGKTFHMNGAASGVLAMKARECILRIQQAKEE